MNHDTDIPDELRRIADELFITTGLKDWTAARALFVDGPIEVDMSSLAGGAAVQITADQLMDGFRAGLHAGKISYHLATNNRIRLKANERNCGPTAMPGTECRNFPRGPISGKRGAITD